MKKAVTYVRVSSKEQKQEGFSIPAQKKLLTDFAFKNDYQIAKEFEDDETAKCAGRSAFGEMIEYLKTTKDVSTILVEKTDRLYRNFKDYVIIDELGITIILVKENEKIGKDASSHQKFIHGIKVLMAKNYIDNLSEESRKGLQQKADSGYYPGSCATIGYKLVTKDSKIIHEIDDQHKDIAIKMFEYYATGLYSLETLIAKIKDDGFKIAEKKTQGFKMKKFTKSSVQRILRNPFYYGDFIWLNKLYKGKHTPLISKDLWDKVQEKLNKFGQKEAMAKYNSIVFAYRGLFTCGECGRTMTAEKKIKPSGLEFVYYRCTKYCTNCLQRPINEKRLDEQLIEKLQGLKLPSQDTVEYVAESLKQSLYFKQSTENKIKENLEEEKKLFETRLGSLYIY